MLGFVIVATLSDIPMTPEAPRRTYFDDIAIPDGAKLEFPDFAATVATPLLTSAELDALTLSSELISRDDLADLFCRC